LVMRGGGAGVVFVKGPVEQYGQIVALAGADGDEPPGGKLAMVRSPRCNRNDFLQFLRARPRSDHLARTA